MNILILSSPFYPLAVSQAISIPGQPSVIPVPFAQWILWRAHVVVPPQSREEMLAIVQSAIAEKVQ
jgi:hypothetical protein